MTFHKPTAATLARLARQRERNRHEATLRLIERLRAKVAQHGADSIWAEMLQEAIDGEGAGIAT